MAEQIDDTEDFDDLFGTTIRYSDDDEKSYRSHYQPSECAKFYRDGRRIVARYLNDEIVHREDEHIVDETYREDFVRRFDEIEGRYDRDFEENYREEDEMYG